MRAEARAITIRQPWASLIAAGVKTIETRSWSTRYRGPLLVHAGKHRPAQFWLNDWTDGPRYYEQIPEPFRSAGIDLDHWFDPQESADGDGQWLYDYRWSKFPLGAVVAVAELVDVVPVVREFDLVDAPYLRPQFSATIARLRRRDGSTADATDQLPFGDFTPGRYGWMISNVRPIDPVPAKGRQGLWTPDRELIDLVSGGSHE